MIFLYTIVVFLSILVIFLIVLLYHHIKAGIVGAPFARTADKRIDAMIKLADIKSGQHIYDLGSGDGEILIKIAKKYKDARCLGYEINPFLYLYSKWRIKKLKLDEQIKIIRKSYWHENMQDADTIFLFLIPYQMKRMETKLKSELKEGTKVLSNCFLFKNWIFDKKRESVYLYRI